MTTAKLANNIKDTQRSTHASCFQQFLNSIYLHKALGLQRAYYQASILKFQCVKQLEAGRYFRL
eukprot:m.337880 g.337880  ORF g.337880 m.337880 type:complete len:64 (+) comp18259_c0_seq1:102-293(+)